jgi:hypothetical protein
MVPLHLADGLTKFELDGDHLVNPKILFMQSTTKRGKLLEVATKLYLQEQGFKTYFWSEWAFQKGLLLRGRKPS